MGPTGGSLHIPLTTAAARVDPVGNTPLPGTSAVVYFRPPVRPGATEVLTITCTSSSTSVVTVYPSALEFSRATFDAVAEGTLQPPSITISATDYYNNGGWSVRCAGCEIQGAASHVVVTCEACA